MEPCISCREYTTHKFKAKPLCDSCKLVVSKLRSNPAENLQKRPEKNIMCKFCFNPPEFLDRSSKSNKITCKSCSIYCKEPVPLKWLDLIQSSADPEIYEKRLNLLSELNLICDMQIESIDNFIINSTHAYNECRKEIASVEEENLKIIDAFEQDIIRKFNDVMASPNILAKVVFLKNLEVFQNEIISMNLLDPEYFREIILEQDGLD